MTVILKQRRDFVTLKQFGAWGDCRNLGNTSIDAASTTVTNTVDAPFVKTDVGAKIWLIGANTDGGVLETTVTAYVSASEITVADAAVTEQTDGRCVIAHDDTMALTGALNYISKKAGYVGGTNLFLGDGHYLTGPQTLPTGTAIFGNGAFQSTLYLKPGSATTNKYLLRNRTSDANRQSYEDFGLNGLREFQADEGVIPEDIDTLKWGPDPDFLDLWETDVYNSYRNLFIAESARAGLSYSGRGQTKFSDITIVKSLVGFELNGFDNSIVGCHASAYGPAFVLGSTAVSNRITNCKGYVSGYEIGDLTYGVGAYANWFLNGASRNEFVACEGHEAWGSNWVLKDAKGNSFSSCRGSDPGCLYAEHTLGADNASEILASWSLTGASSDNSFANCRASIGAHGTTSHATNALFMSGTCANNRGDIYYDLDPAMTFSDAAVDNTSSGANTGLKVNGTALT